MIAGIDSVFSKRPALRRVKSGPPLFSESLSDNTRERQQNRELIFTTLCNENRGGNILIEGFPTGSERTPPSSEDLPTFASSPLSHTGLQAVCSTADLAIREVDLPSAEFRGRPSHSFAKRRYSNRKSSPNRSRQLEVQQSVLGTSCLNGEVSMLCRFECSEHPGEVLICPAMPKVSSC